MNRGIRAEKSLKNHERREAMRETWETDPSVTRESIAKLLGMAAETIGRHAIACGWARSDEVAMQAQIIRADRCRDAMKKAISDGYVVDNSAANAARAAKKLGQKTTYKKDRRYPCWDTRQKEREYTPPKRYASVFAYCSEVTE